MTRGQGSLVVDDGHAGQGGAARAEQTDLRSFQLPVLQATADERAAHETVLADIDKASGGKTLWRALAQTTPEAVA